MTPHLAQVQKIAYGFLKGRPIFSKIKVIDSKPGSVTCLFTVEKEHLNIGNNLFGGYTAGLVDICGSLAIASKEEAQGKFGVSTDLSISFQRAAALGDQIKIEAYCSKVGKNLAFTRVELFVDEKMIAHGSHTKYMGGNQ